MVSQPKQKKEFRKRTLVIIDLGFNLYPCENQYYRCFFIYKNMSFKITGAGYDLSVFKDSQNGFIYKSGICGAYFTKSELLEIKKAIQKTIDYYEINNFNDNDVLQWTEDRENRILGDPYRNISKSLTKDKEDHLYVILDSVNKSLKIGRSKNVSQRFKTLQLSTSNKLELLTVIAKAGDLEKVVHEEFASKRLASEWFQDCNEIRKYLGII